MPVQYYFNGDTFADLASAKTARNNFITQLEASPSSWVNVKPVTQNASGHFIVGDDGFLTDEEILAGSFSGHYNVHQMYNGYTSIGCEAEYVQNLLDDALVAVISYVPDIIEVEVPE